MIDVMFGLFSGVAKLRVSNSCALVCKQLQLRRGEEAAEEVFEGD